MEMDRCHFWLATFADRGQIDEYLRQNYGDDDKPISLFAGDQGERFYDHDWVFVESNDSGNLEEILRKAQVPEATGRILKEFAKTHGLGSNALIVADQEQFTNPVSVEKNSYKLIYAGCYSLFPQQRMPRRFGIHASVIQLLALFITGTALDGGTSLDACMLASLPFWTCSLSLLWWSRGRVSRIELFFFRWGLSAFVLIGTPLLITVVKRWTWLPLLLYPCLALTITAALLYLITRVFGLRSPFDDMPPWPEV